MEFEPGVHDSLVQWLISVNITVPGHLLEEHYLFAKNTTFAGIKKEDERNECLYDSPLKMGNITYCLP